MADIKCAVCGEPWEAYGHGDMARWQWRLFKAGAGCPGCEGEPTTHDHDSTEDHVRSVVNEAEDPDSFELLHGDWSADRPAWIEPPAPVLAECAGCEVKVLWGNDAPTDKPTGSRDDDLWFEWQYPLRAPWRRHDPTPDDFETIGDATYCDACVAHCKQCGETVLADQYGLDACSAGYALQRQEGMGTESVCGGCASDMCLECFDSHEDCECDDHAWRWLRLRERIESCAKQGLSIFAARRDEPPAGWDRDR